MASKNNTAFHFELSNVIRINYKREIMKKGNRKGDGKKNVKQEKIWKHIMKSFAEINLQDVRKEMKKTWN